MDAGDADRFPGMADLAPGQAGDADQPQIPPEIRVLLNMPLAAWQDADWQTAGWVQVTDPRVSQTTGVELGQYVPPLPTRDLTPGEPDYLEAEWMQLGWTRLRQDPLDPHSPLEITTDGMEVWVPPGPAEWRGIRNYARFAPPGGVPPAWVPAAPAAPAGHGADQAQTPPHAAAQYPQYHGQTYAAPTSPVPGWNGWGSPLTPSPAYGGMPPLFPTGPPPGWGSMPPPPPTTSPELLEARRKLDEAAAKEKAAQDKKIEELSTQVTALLSKLQIQETTIARLRAPGERAGMQPAGGSHQDTYTPSASHNAGAYGMGINSRIPDGDSCRRQLFSGPSGVAQPLTRELKELFLQYHVAEEVQSKIAEHGCSDCQTFYHVGHDYKEARAAFAQLAGIELNGVGVVQVAQLLTVWQALAERYTQQKDIPDEAAAQVVVEQAHSMLAELGMNLHPYLQPDAVSLNIVLKNYRSKRYEAVDVQKFKSNSMDPGDPLSYRTRQKKTDKRFVQVPDAPGQWTQLDHEECLDLKQYKRAMELFMWAELTVGNMCHPKQDGEHPHFTLADKVSYETHLARFGFDPAVRLRMELPQLKAAEIHVRSHIMQLIKAGNNWRDALQKLSMMIEQKFQLKSELATVEITTAQKEVALLKGQIKQMQQKQDSMQQKLARAFVRNKGGGKGKNGGKGGGKGGGGRGGYGAWRGEDAWQHPDAPKGGTAKHPYCTDFLQTHPQTGDAFCRKYNRGVPHDDKDCKAKKYLHQCSWKDCTNRKNCKTPGIKHK